MSRHRAQELDRPAFLHVMQQKYAEELFLLLNIKMSIARQKFTGFHRLYYIPGTPKMIDRSCETCNSLVTCSLDF